MVQMSDNKRAIMSAVTGVTVLIVDAELLRCIDDAARKRGWSKGEVLLAALDALEQQGSLGSMPPDAD